MVIIDFWKMTNTAAQLEDYLVHPCRRSGSNPGLFDQDLKIGSHFFCHVLGPLDEIFQKFTELTKENITNKS